MRHSCITTLSFWWWVDIYLFKNRFLLDLRSSYNFLCSTFWFFLQTMMVWLWGVNLWVFSQGSANYTKIFDLDQNHLTHHEIWKVLKLFQWYLFHWWLHLQQMRKEPHLMLKFLNPLAWALIFYAEQSVLMTLFSLCETQKQKLFIAQWMNMYIEYLDVSAAIMD